MISLGLAAVVSAADAGIYKKKKKNLSSVTATLIISNEDIEDIM